MTDDDRLAPRDLGWLAAGVAFALLTARYLWDIAALIVAGDGGARDVVLLSIVGVVVALGGVWLTVGAWRRTRWGRPDEPGS